MNTINLFCFPFAGGNKYSYRVYEENASPKLKIRTLEYPGRGFRIKEPLITDMESLVADSLRRISPLIKGTPYAIYGHSLGGIVAYLLCRKIFETPDMARPMHLFITGTMGPGCRKRKELQRHLLPRTEFVEEIRNLDGCPEEVLANDELLSYFEPLLRADFQVSETYHYIHEKPLDLPITVIAGTEEDMSDEEIGTWQLETTQPVEFRRMKGKHFFILKYPGELVRTFSGKLLLTTQNLRS
jgi:surfactin synthase thioesterase subunit